MSTFALCSGARHGLASGTCAPRIAESEDPRHLSNQVSQNRVHGVWHGLRAVHPQSQRAAPQPSRGGRGSISVRAETDRNKGTGSSPGSPRSGGNRNGSGVNPGAGVGAGLGPGSSGNRNRFLRAADLAALAESSPPTPGSILSAASTLPPPFRGGEEEFRVACVNETRILAGAGPGSDSDSEGETVTVIHVWGVDQENLLADLTMCLNEMNVSVLKASIRTENDNRIWDTFRVVDTITRAPLAPERFGHVETRIKQKLHKFSGIRESDAALADQIGFLTGVLDNLVMEQPGGNRVVETVRYLQEGFQQLRGGDPTEMMEYIKGLDKDMLTSVIRVFYLYSSLCTVADEAHQFIDREGQLNSSVTATPQLFASFDHTFRLFKTNNVGPQELQKLLNTIEYYPVFTAHPTEARRREILTCLTRIFRLCSARLSKTLSVAMKIEIEREVAAEIAILYRTDEMRSSKPTVIEEIQTGLDYFRYSIFDAVVTMYRYAENSLQDVYPRGNVQLPSFVKFGSWIGGDRDGNPFVLPETTEAAALLQSRLILNEYIRRCRALQDTLTHSTTTCNFSKELLQCLEADGKVLDKAPSLRADREAFGTEPYRLKLRVIRHRLEQNLISTTNRLKELAKRTPGMETLAVRIIMNLDDVPDGSQHLDAYADEEEFLSDLLLMRRSLRENGDTLLADSKLRDLIRLAETFKFFLVALDVRQESAIHREAVTECMSIMGLGDYAAMSEDEKIAAMTAAITSPPPTESIKELRGKMTESTRRVVDVFDACANIMETISRDAIASYIISMTRSASNVIEVLFLAWISCRNLVGIDNKGRSYAKIVVTPLFETIADLQKMPESLEKLLANNMYREMVKGSGNTQEVMLGYSDSCKDGGIMSSAFTLYKAQGIIREITQEAGVQSRIFHGRGGTVGRGHAPSHDGVLSQPPGSVQGKIKFTEQGEVITNRYGSSEVATWELTLGITGLMKASHPTTRRIQEENALFQDIMEKMTAASEAAYRQLTDETPGFYDYLYEATVVNEFALMNMGSRPSRRKAAVRDKSSLRAIPWVFGWSQSRHTLPAWYGVGTGILAYTQDNPVRIQELQKMYEQWAFFKSFLSSVEMSLFKASVEIARQYAHLCADKEVEARVFKMFVKEYNLTKAQLFQITQQNSLLENYEQLFFSINARKEYLDPLNHIQVALLQRRRDATTEEEVKEWEMPLLRSMKAIASNMRNTG